MNLKIRNELLQFSYNVFFRRLSYLVLNACFSRFKSTLIIPIPNRLKREIERLTRDMSKIEASMRV